MFNLDVLSAVLVFSVIIFILVSIISFAEKKLLPQGDVNILVNKDKNITIKPGGTLLSALSSQSYHTFFLNGFTAHNS